MLSLRSSILERVLIAYARGFPIRRGKLRVVNKLWPLVMGDDCTYRFASLKYGDLMIECDVAEMLQRQMYFFGTYFVEEKIIDNWMMAAKNSNVIFDVGANAGIYSLAALVARPTADVHAFEPTPEIAARLRETVKLNCLRSLTVHEAAVHKEDGLATLRRCRGALGSNEGMNYVSLSDAEEGLERVRTVSLDGFCESSRIDRIDLLKIDIQGQEHSALIGARNMIRNHKITRIFMELNWAQRESEFCPATECIRLLSEQGYRFAHPERCDDWRDAGDWLRGLGDVVAICEAGGNWLT
jgi:FkbM family methyltransferase